MDELTVTLPLVTCVDQENYGQHEVAVAGDLEILDELCPLHLRFDDVELPLPELLQDLLLLLLLFSEGLKD